MCWGGCTEAPAQTSHSAVRTEMKQNRQSKRQEKYLLSSGMNHSSRLVFCSSALTRSTTDIGTEWSFSLSKNEE